MLNKVIKNPLFLGVFVALFFELPYLILGQDAHLYIEDNLDAVVSCFLVMIKTGKMFDFHSYIEPIMNGLPRVFLANGINLSTVGMLFFSPFKAYLINDFLVHLIGFAGMYLLLKDYIIKPSRYSFLIILGVATSWALIPHFSIYGISIAGQPLLLYAFFNLQKNQRKLESFLIIILFVVYSMLVFVGVFLIATAGVYFLYLWFFKKEFNRNILLGTIFLFLGYFIVEYQLIEWVLFNKELVSHRVEKKLSYYDADIYDSLNSAIINFAAGHFHAKSMHFFILLFSIGTVTYLLIKKRAPKTRKLLIALISILFISSLIYAFSRWKEVVPLYEVVPFLKSFQITRLIWLTPVIWYIVFALCLKAVSKENIGHILIPAVIFGQITYVLLYHPEIQYHTKFVYKNTGPKVSYREFYSEKMFQEIKAYIGLPQESYRTVCLGIHPAIPQYSGFYTLDSYQNNYLLDYKKEFRKIIEKELKKSKGWTNYFDNWGNRCYLVSSEFKPHSSSFMLTKSKNLRIKRLEINTTALKRMGGQYLFSAVEIENAQEMSLSLKKVFEHHESPWQIYLYKVN